MCSFAAAAPLPPRPRRLPRRAPASELRADFAVAGCEGEKDGACERPRAKSQCDELQGQHCDANCFGERVGAQDAGGRRLRLGVARGPHVLLRPTAGGRDRKLVAFTDPELLTRARRRRRRRSPSSDDAAAAAAAAHGGHVHPSDARCGRPGARERHRQRPALPDVSRRGLASKCRPLAPQAAGATLPTLSPPPPPEGAAGRSRKTPAAPSRPSRRRRRRRPKTTDGAETHSGADVGGAGVGTFCRAILLPPGCSAPASEPRMRRRRRRWTRWSSRECGAVEVRALQPSRRRPTAKGWCRPAAAARWSGRSPSGAAAPGADGEQPPRRRRRRRRPPRVAAARRALAAAAAVAGGRTARRRRRSRSAAPCERPRRRLTAASRVPAAAGGASGWRLSECADLVVRLAPEASGATINFDDGACYAELEMTRAVPGCAARISAARATGAR